jgi:hypothetical protein
MNTNTGSHTEVLSLKRRGSHQVKRVKFLILTICNIFLQKKVFHEECAPAKVKDKDLPPIFYIEKGECNTHG